MDVSLIDWSRLQFAVTAGYHWLFVPLTLGLGLVVSIMETIYFRKGDEYWKEVTKFWMKLFAINFAVGIATGLILEFEFGTNWSNYSWLVGDIFGAPLAIEGILAFFMEATFFAVMFFGWNKVGKKFHLASTWLTAIGAAISAYWILVANGWMQNPVGTQFNPDTVRNEMVSFWTVAGNPVAVSKFFHSVFSGWMTGGVFVIGVSAWYMLKKRDLRFAKSSMAVGALVGIVGGVAVMLAGDSSGVHVAKYQPMKLAVAEGLEDGGTKVPFSIVPGVKVPGMLSILATHDVNGFVPGINDIIMGYTDNNGQEVAPVDVKMWRGKRALSALKIYRAQEDTSSLKASLSRQILKDNAKYMGYGHLSDPSDVVPNVPLVYWSFRAMIYFGCFVMLVLILVQFFLYKDKVHNLKWLLRLAIISIPLVYLCGQAGWIVSEVGRQPWAIQDLLPVNAAVSSLSVGAVKTTFFIFLAVFALFLVIEIKIMLNAIRKGPEIQEVEIQSDNTEK
ncbi:MAG: cytochrome ubiquinol oxidase subunit I [Bacteroidales bacterium]